MATQCAQIMGWYVLMDYRYDWLGDQYIYVMTSQGDTNMCAQINTRTNQRK